MPRVSVIIPNYNYARYLPERLASVMSQTVQDMEILFLDDASQDDSIRVVTEIMRGSRIAHQIHINDTNSGSPFVQWNRGARLARGEYLWIAEADDCCEPDFLARLLSMLEAHPKVNLGYSQSRPVDSRGRAVNDQPNYLDYTNDLDTEKWTRDHVREGRVEVLDYMLIMNTIPNVSATMIRREAYLDVGGAPEDYRLSGDWILYLKLLLRGDIAFCASVLNHHRIHAASITRNTVLDLTYFRELLRVQGFIQNAFELGPRHHDLLRAKFFRDWNHLADGPFGRISRLSLIRLALLALRHKPGWGPRILRTLVHTLQKR